MFFSNHDDAKKQRFFDFILQTLSFLKEAHLGKLHEPFQDLLKTLIPCVHVNKVAECYGVMVRSFKEDNFLMMEARQSAINALRQLEMLNNSYG
jgi:hypothetical protein